jgi:Type III secretion protein (HpaP).
MSNSIRPDAMRPEPAGSRTDATQGHGTPNPDAKDDFERAMEKRGGESSEEQGSDGEDGQHSQAMPSASSLLSSLFEGKMSPVTAPAPAVSNLDDLVDDLVQRILVSDPKSGSPAEIRLQINDAVLPDTEIILQRGPDGLLSVLLTSGNASSLQTLISAQQILAEQLERHGPANVRVASTEESRQGDNDANRRSQGLMDYEPENL